MVGSASYVNNRVLQLHGAGIAVILVGSASYVNNRVLQLHGVV